MIFKCFLLLSELLVIKQHNDFIGNQCSIQSKKGKRTLSQDIQDPILTDDVEAETPILWPPDAKS